jgi:hypothetical protein
VKKAKSKEPFQNFVFLIRDWNNEDEFAFGLDGGNKYLLKQMHSNISEIKQMQDSIHKAFKKINCFLMPEPGRQVKKKSFTGALKELDNDFALNLKEVISFFFCL